MPKTIAELIAGAVPALSGLRASLVRAREALAAARDQAPDLAPVLDSRIADLDSKIALLDGVASADGLKALGLTVISELASLPKDGLQPRSHPGDVTGG